MSLIKSLFTKFRQRQSPPQGLSGSGSGKLQIEALVQAHGDWLALLATILERERVITSSPDSPAPCPSLPRVQTDRPAEGEILSFWASRLNDAAATCRQISVRFMGSLFHG